MAKINIELNLEDLGSYFDEESGTLDFESFMSDEIQSQISAKIVSKIEDEQIKKIEKHISESLEGLVSKLESKLDEKVNEITKNLLNRNITIYDKWGDKVKENVNIMDMFKQKMLFYSGIPMMLFAAILFICSTFPGFADVVTKFFPWKVSDIPKNKHQALIKAMTCILIELENESNMISEGSATTVQ